MEEGTEPVAGTGLERPRGGGASGVWRWGLGDCWGLLFFFVWFFSFFLVWGLLFFGFLALGFGGGDYLGFVLCSLALSLGGCRGSFGAI